VRKATLRLAKDAGRGDSSYQDYDQKITDAAVAWLHARAKSPADKPWALFVSLVCPHFPLIARPEWYDLYPESEVPLPPLYGAAERPNHPYVAAFRECQIYDRGFADEANLRRAITAYFGLVSYTDHNIGRLMAALGAAGIENNTRIIYSADHGDNLGTRGLWGKSTMYEETAGVPLIMQGVDIPVGRVVATPTSHVDIHPFIMDCVDAGAADDDHPGYSLFDIANGLQPPRTVLSEYHGMGSTTGAFMIRNSGAGR